MPARNLKITHTFAGGWATAFGTSVPGLGPDQAGNMPIPFLVTADDVEFEANGAPRKAPGADKINSSAISVGGDDVIGVFDYWKTGTGASPSQRRVVHVGTDIQADSGDGSFSQIKGGLTAGALPDYTTFDDLLIISSDASGDVPFSWDQTTFQNLAGTPPNFSFSERHNNVVFAAGVAANPSILYYSKNVDPEDWSEAGGTTGIAIEPSDGDSIRGIISHKNELWVFKGDKTGSIHRITGTSSADFALKSFIKGVGAVGQRSIFRIGDDIGFLSPDGSIRTLAATDQFGDFREASLSADIQPWIDEHLNFTQIKLVQTATGPAGRRVYFAMPIDGSSTNNVVLVLDTGFRPFRWSKLPSYAAASVALLQDTSRPFIMFGGYDGFLRKYGIVNRSIDTTTGLSYNVETPYLDYGTIFNEKIVTGLGMGIQPHGAGDITFGWSRDNNVQQTTTIAQGGAGDRLATAVPATDNFTLGTSTLGGARFLTRFAELEGEFKTIQYQFTNAINNTDTEIHSFAVRLAPGAESLEN